MIGIINCKIANLQSVLNALNKIDAKVKLVDNKKDIQKCSKILLPGVGAYKDGMNFLIQNEIDEAIRNHVKDGKYLLGICLGMQLLFEKSYEFGENNGLGLLKGGIKFFDKTKFKENLKIPHVGWNKIFMTQKSPLLKDIQNESFLYFVHSFHANSSNEIAKTIYGYEFSSIVQKDNIFGIQAHPEKSYENGLKILKNFKEL